MYGGGGGGGAAANYQCFCPFIVRPMMLQKALYEILFFIIRVKQSAAPTLYTRYVRGTVCEPSPNVCT